MELLSVTYEELDRQSAEVLPERLVLSTLPIGNLLSTVTGVLGIGSVGSGSGLPVVGSLGGGGLGGGALGSGGVGGGTLGL